MSTTKTISRKPTTYGKYDSISIIVPSFNNEKTIGKCMESLVKQDYPKDLFEILVVDNLSKDKTESICGQFKGVKFIKKLSSPAQARNYGAKVAKGSIILFTDSDCIAPKNMLKKIMSNFKRYDVAGVGGAYKTFNKENPVARFVGYEIAWRHSKQPKFTDFLGTYCCAYKKDIFLKFGGFDTSFKIASGEDPELSFKISQGGYKLAFDNTIFVWHTHPEKLKKYLKQQFFRAYWRVNMYNKHPQKIGGDVYTGIEIPFAPLMLGLFALCIPLSIVFSFAPYIALASLFAYFAIYSSFFKFVYKEEGSLVPFTISVTILRTVYWIAGFAYGLKMIFKKV